MPRYVFDNFPFISVIATGIQYCMNYAAHWERKFTISENITAEVKRRQKRLKKEGKSDDDIKAQVRTFTLLCSKVIGLEYYTS